jgi:hypothetical protein
MRDERVSVRGITVENIESEEGVGCKTRKKRSETSRCVVISFVLVNPKIQSRQRAEGSVLIAFRLNMQITKTLLIFRMDAAAARDRAKKKGK